MGARLDLRDLLIGYREPLIDPVSLAIDASQVTAVLGASGSGKSTLLATIAGVTPPLGGAIAVDGRDVTHARIQDRGVGIVFQEPLLFPHLDVGDNVAYGLRRHGMAKAQARGRAQELLAWLGLDGYVDRPVRELSGGQAQRVALGRALAPEPAVLLLDEPFSALDVDLRQRLVDEVGALLRERGTAALYVTHDPREADAIADQVVRISART